ncbi:MAG: Acetate kinase [Verrucomicrobiaceae bacterium]|nr:Acetate kinase [Verrucomicrobiaceae bacterium]
MDAILTINGGSSSIRFAVYEAGRTLRRLLHGKVDRIGAEEAALTYQETEAGTSSTLPIKAGDHHAAADALLAWLEPRAEFSLIKAVGHRLVHGMSHTQPEEVTPELLEELRTFVPYDPDHLPHEIQLMEAMGRRHPQLLQVACFDTAFHDDLPRVARQLAIPRRYETKGVRRYGFHGLSYAFLMEELARLDQVEAADGRIILAHLGSGASMAAVHDGRCIDTTMAFTPAAGLVMSTRSGDLDPGLMAFLARTEQMTAGQFQQMVNHESGLLGISETSSDMRDLLVREADDTRAAEAVALFCYEAKKRIGAYAAALGGLDTLVFAGGIGENCAAVRLRICEGLEFLGIELDAVRNTAHAPVISTNTGRVMVRVIRTDEEFMIATSVTRLMRRTAP